MVKTVKKQADIDTQKKLLWHQNDSADVESAVSQRHQVKLYSFIQAFDELMIDGLGVDKSVDDVSEEKIGDDLCRLSQFWWSYQLTSKSRISDAGEPSVL